ncbi:Nuclear receptor VDR-b isoform X1 [Aphelenchoides fujianensis]|nr:Nuclear receptor VDR-b isoform X1 [Aphelenchoides fujianensis]
MPPTSCPVCPAPVASKHFGGYSCLKCRTFFRRAVRKRLAFVCNGENKCEISADGRKACQKCRFDRCLAAGLDPKLVHSDRLWEEGSCTRKPAESTTTAIVSAASAPTVCKDLFVNYEGPLGFRSAVEQPTGRDFPSLLRFFKLAEAFVDEFQDTGYTHIGNTAPFYHFDLSLRVEEAFLVTPRRLSSRTKARAILWTAQSWITDHSLRQIWARSMLHLVDVISHIPELRLLNPSDQLRLIVSRGLGYGGLLVIHRTLRNSNLKCILTTGGTYLPLNEDELRRKA